MGNNKNNRTDWVSKLDVVNCGAFHSTQVEHKVYACPAKKGAYSHKRCEYLGMYWGKSVQRVARIRGVVDIDPAGKVEARVWWNNEDPLVLSDTDLIEHAKERLELCFPIDTKVSHRNPHRVFVLGEPILTDFRKTSDGGMFTSKMYFNVERYQPTSAANLAEILSTKTWAEYGR